MKIIPLSLASCRIVSTGSEKSFVELDFSAVRSS